MRDEFWVVGGSYRDVSFAALHPDAGELYGPFLDYAAALDCWRERSSTTRSEATMRFTVVTTARRANPAPEARSG